MRVGTDKRSVSKAAVAETMSRTTTHKHVGSPAFDITDPVQRLMFTIGSGFFGEHKFYDGLQPEDARGHRVSTNIQVDYNGKSVTYPTNVTDGKGFNESAQDLLSTMRQLAEDPERIEDLLILARWAREDLNLRQTPLMALVMAARVESEQARGTGLIRKYAPLILRRADEPKRAFAAYRHLFLTGPDGMRKGSLPKGFARGLIAALQQFNEYQILKYDSQREKPTFRELALLLSKYEGRGKNRQNRKNMRAFSPAMAKYLIDGEADPEQLPKAHARKELAKCGSWNAKAQKLAKVADLTWENMISQFGSNAENWEWLLENKQIPFMACLRNLRNFEKAGISSKAWDLVYDALTRDANHRQLPFRFLAARDHVTNQTAMSAIDVAMDKSVENIPDLGGETFIMVDASGSMDQAVSGKSTMTAKDAGNAMAAILAKRIGRRATLGVFGQSFALVPFSEADSVMNIAKSLRAAGNRVGHSTNAYLALEYLLGESRSRIRQPVKVDRIVIVSDMACYNSGWGMSSLVEMLARYRATVNREAFYYSVNLCGSSQSQMDPQDEHTLLLSGFSEKVFSLFNQFEAGKVEAGEAASSAELPTLETLRAKFRAE